MATIHFHIAQACLFMDFFFVFRGVPGNNLAPIQNLLGCKVCQIRSRGRCFEAEISLFMMFFYDFHLIYKVFINILEYANEVISYTSTR